MYCEYGDFHPRKWIHNIAGEMGPDDVTDWAFEWVGWLAGDTIETSEFTLDGLTQVSAGVFGSMTQVVVSGGTVGRIYLIKNQITTTGGRRKSKTIAVRVREAS